MNVGDWFTRPVATLPNFPQTLSDYMAMPTKANGEPVDFHTYPTHHNGTMAASLPDSIPFVRARMR